MSVEGLPEGVKYWKFSDEALIRLEHHSWNMLRSPLLRSKMSRWVRIIPLLPKPTEIFVLDRNVSDMLPTVLLSQRWHNKCKFTFIQWHGVVIIVINHCAVIDEIRICLGVLAAWGCFPRSILTPNYWLCKYCVSALYNRSLHTLLI